MLLTVGQQVDIPAALQLLLGLGLAVFGFWFIPVAVGAALGIADAEGAFDDDEEDDVSNLGQHSKASKSAFYSPMGKGKWGGMKGFHGDWQKAGRVATPGRQGVYSARGQRYGSRTQEGQGLGMLRQYASGEKSAARLAAQDAINRTQQAMSSQAAAAGASPAAQRAAMYGGAAAGQNIAGKTASAAAAEQLGAQKAYVGGLGARRRMDAANQALEQQWFGQQGAFGLGQNQQRLRAMGMGMQQSEAERRARMQYEMMLRGQSMQQQQLNLQQQQSDRQFGTQLFATGANLVSSFLGAPGSDRNMKEGVSPADSSDIFGSANQALTQRDDASAASLAARQADYAGRGAGPGAWVDPYGNQDVFTASQQVPAAPAPPAIPQTMADIGDPRTFDQRREDLGAAQLAANMQPDPAPAQAAGGAPADGGWFRSTPLGQFVYGSAEEQQQALGIGRRPAMSPRQKALAAGMRPWQPQMSDRTGKKALQDASYEDVAKEFYQRYQGAESMMDALKAKTYRYKDPSEPGAAPGRQVGVMAQDLEKSQMGRDLVFEGPRGKKMVDFPSAGPAFAAGLANLNERQGRIEQALGIGPSEARQSTGEEPAGAPQMGQVAPPMGQQVQALHAEEAALPQPPQGYNPFPGVTFDPQGRAMYPAQQPPQPQQPVPPLAQFVGAAVQRYPWLAGGGRR
jgi:hypothetical protein